MARADKPPVVLTIAGFDPSSGAGVTADLQVFAAHGLFGTACISALTVQSTRAVRAVESTAHLMAATLTELDADLPAAGVKIGMLGSAEAVDAVVTFLCKRSVPGPVVLDPVVRSSSGAALLSEDGLNLLRREVLPLVDWVTPNRAELGDLVGSGRVAASGVEPAMRALAERHPKLHVVTTGGEDGASDCLLTPNGAFHRFEGRRVDTTSTHGTGCAFSSALLSCLVLGKDAAQAVAAAKAYVVGALENAPGVGQGRGPMGLLWPLTRRDE